MAFFEMVYDNEIELIIQLVIFLGKGKLFLLKKRLLKKHTPGPKQIIRYLLMVSRYLDYIPFFHYALIIIRSALLICRSNFL